MDLLIRGRVLLISLAICLGQGVVFLQAPHQKIRVELHWAEMALSKGLTEARVPKTGERLYLHKEALITNEDIIEAQAVEDPYIKGGYKVNLVFTKKAAERMMKASKLHNGQRLAILVDGLVISAPIIHGSIYDKVSITGEMDKDEAQSIAKSLNQTSRKTTR